MILEFKNTTKCLHPGSYDVLELIELIPALIILGWSLHVHFELCFSPFRQAL